MVLDSGCIVHYSDLIRPMAVRLVPVLNSGLEIMSEADPLGLSYFSHSQSAMSSSVWRASTSKSPSQCSTGTSARMRRRQSDSRPTGARFYLPGGSGGTTMPLPRSALGRKNARPREQAAKRIEVTLVARTGDTSSGPHRRSRCPVEFVIDATADDRTGVAKELDPGRGIDQDHVVRLRRISSRSPFQPDPRRRRASSRPRGSAARMRNARLTASRLDVSR